MVDLSNAKKEEKLSMTEAKNSKKGSVIFLNKSINDQQSESMSNISRVPSKVRFNHLRVRTTK